MTNHRQLMNWWSHKTKLCFIFSQLGFVAVIVALIFNREDIAFNAFIFQMAFVVFLSISSIMSIYHSRKFREEMK